MNRGARLTVCIVRAAAIAGALALTFMFVHRAVLGWGGGSVGSPWQHEDRYGLPVFALFFGGCLLYPLPSRWVLGFAVARSALFTTALLLCMGIVGAGSPLTHDGSFHLETFLGIVGVCAFTGLLLASKPFHPAASHEPPGRSS
ncbi:MAG: hypothetical protein H6825_01455 [Planctomycetes bacterium]|nr:hypothetical protein [Planctomycetota bacterium]